MYTDVANMWFCNKKIDFYEEDTLCFVVCDAPRGLWLEE